MNIKSAKVKQLIPICLAAVICLHFLPQGAQSAVMNDYCVRPPFISQSVPPMVMFEIGRDHKLYYEAYNDGVDLDGDGKIEKTYDHSIAYYGYFNPNKCYTQPAGASNNDYFTPVATATNRFCSAGRWSGNFLNWLTMSRADVLRKVMYGGQRSQESPKILLNRAYIPQDAHSWGKEYTGRLCYNGTTYRQMCTDNADCTDSGYTCQDKSENLIGSAAPTGATSCTATGVTWGSGGGSGKLLVVRYPNDTSKTGNDHADMMAAFDSTQFKSGFDPTYVSGFDDSILDPGAGHDDKYATMVVAQFYVAKDRNGGWQFAIDGDDGVELEVRNLANGNIVQTTAGSNQISYYGAHGQSSGQTHSGTINLAEKTWYRLIVRHAEGTGEDGVKVWFKRPGASAWTIFGQRNSNPSLDVRAPDITIGTNDCTLRSQNFINTGIPTANSETSPPRRHLFCNTTLADGVPTSSTSTKSLLRMITNSSHRIWEWASKERPVCDNTFDDGSSAATDRTDFTMQTEVCKSGVGTLSEDDRFERCRNYGGTYDAGTGTYTGGTYMPIGLFQKYGEYVEDGSGISKVCSKSMAKSCNNDSGCDTGEGLCFDKSRMYFGFMTTSYTKNTSGGVLRKNPGPVSDEVHDNGTLKTAENDRGNMIISMDRLKMIDFDYGGLDPYKYSNCGWKTNGPFAEGECTMWGNPVAEMMYESLRYFAGKGVPTAEFVWDSPINFPTYTPKADSGVDLSRPHWGFNKGSDWYQPFDIFPSCSQPFLLVLSDVNTSYDSDQIPGSSYSSFTEDTALPQLGLGVTQANGKSLLNSLLDTIGSVEGVDGNNWFVGESSGATDFICSAKNATNLHTLRGTCPEEPTKKGSYYAAAVAYYGKSLFAAKTGKNPVSTFVVALSSPFADIKIKAGGSFVSVVPVAKSVSGCGIDKCLGYTVGSASCTYTTDTSGRFSFSNCPTDAFCPTNSLVDFYVDDLRYDGSNNIVYAKFRINFEDVEQGADHDMDAIATYEICTDAAAGLYGSCGSLEAGNHLQVKVNSDYAAGCIDQVLGFVVSGTTEDGTYLVVRDKDIGGGSLVSGLPIAWNKEFATSATPGAGYLKNPLWYAAKWGGYTGSGMPDTTTKWDKDLDGLPDNYFPVSNPLQLDQQLDLALTAILARTSAGTAASIVNNRGQSGANILSAIFYPEKEFGKDDAGEDQKLSWVGDLQNYWYYFDPFLSNSTMREDTIADTPDPILNLLQDYKIDIKFDSAQNKTVGARFRDVDGKGTYTSVDTKDIDDLHALWRAGLQLHSRSLTDNPRTIYTQIDDANRYVFSTAAANAAALQPYLGAADLAASQKIIKYVQGFDTPTDTTLRSRSVTYQGVTPSATTAVGVWKLGDIINSTPKIQSGGPLNGYHLDYGDTSYRAFINTSDYVSNTMVYAGANDGMLHAFRLGKNIPLPSTTGTVISKLTNPGTTPPALGSEVWAFIPKNALPYLKYLTDPSYSHLYYVDNTPLLVDASINKPASCDSLSNYWDCPKITTISGTDLVPGETSWRSVLVGSMGLGGASRPQNGSCTAISGTLPDSLANCVKTPLATSGYTSLGLSSFFAFDVTNSANPNLLWEFSHPDLGYSTVDPVIVRINGRKGGLGPDANDPDTTKNGRWFLVFGSGPTGPIETTSHQFYARSDQNLKIFVVDLHAEAPFVENSNYWVFDTSIANAFSGSLATNGVNVDKKALNSNRFYETEVVYVGYVKPDATATPKTWTDGGILRLVTNGDTNPANWTWSTLIDGVGPVTASIEKLYDDKDTTNGTVVASPTLWLYFGSGRFYYKNASAGIDSATNQMQLYGIKDPCYSVNNAGGTWAKDLSKHLNTTCTADPSISLVLKSALTDQTDDIPHALQTNHKGWFINLDASTTTYSAERLITTPDARTNGMVVFTTFKPTAGVCGFGGETFFWFTDYKTGGPPPLGALTGKVIIQLSTGAIIVVDLSKIIGGGGGGGGTGGTGGASDSLYRGGRQLDVGAGKPPTPKPATDSLKAPVKKILQIQEK
jgi:type IV pilus assembly protein PilY1